MFAFEELQEASGLWVPALTTPEDALEPSGYSQKLKKLRRESTAPLPVTTLISYNPSDVL